MTKKSLEIGKILVPDQDAANRLKQALIQSADSASTRRNRQHFWKKFKEWCETHDSNPLPTEPDAVVMYLLDQAGQGMKKSTLNNMAGQSKLFTSNKVSRPPPTTLKRNN